MPERSVFFFADASQDTHAALKKLLRASGKVGFLSLFLKQVSTALRDELATLNPLEGKDLPPFRELSDICSPRFEQARKHPAFHLAETVLVQLGNLILHYENRPEEPWVAPREDLVVGVCVGEISAAAVALSSGLADLIPRGVAAVRLAFRTGLRAAIAGDDIETRESPPRSWAASIQTTSGIVDQETLSRAAAEAGLTGNDTPWLVSRSVNRVSIGASPTTLSRFLAHLAERRKKEAPLSPVDVQVFAPYHSPNIYTHQDVSQILEHHGELEPLVSDLPLPAQAASHMSGADGRFIREQTSKVYLEESICRVLSCPIDVDELTRACSRHISASDSDEWRIRPAAQVAAAKTLAHELKGLPNRQISIDLSICSDSVNGSSPRHVPIAIVGMAGRFPEASNPDELWKILYDGRDVHSKVPSDRFDPDSHLERPAFGSFIDQPGRFDNQFFKMSPREALQTDPGQRLALVTAFEAMEMAGFVPGRTPSSRLERVGTFFGQVTDEYKEQNLAQEVGTHFIPGSLRPFGPGRINHFFKFGGPSMTVDTACSASLSALHVACNSIWSGECDTAIVGGMNILSSSDNFNGLSAGHFLSPTGGCKTFDDAADGYCRGETVASLVIKPLADAIADNDHILANILSIHTNYSHGAVSITHPWAPAQQDLYTKVLRDASIEPHDVNYVEMHGTGTQAGDLEEMTSVLNVFAPHPHFRDPSNPLLVGSVKANIGHGESASGVAALIKTILMLKERKVPIHCGIKGSLNRKFPNLEERHVRIPRSTQALSAIFPRASKQRYLINNFSASGGNTACVIEEASSRPTGIPGAIRKEAYAIAVSAKTASALRSNLSRLATHIRSDPSISIADLSYTTTARRVHHSRRWCAVASNIEHLDAQVQRALASEEFPSIQKPSKICFVFTGQGLWHIPEARKLFASCEFFRAEVSRYDQIATSFGFGSFIRLLRDDHFTQDGSVPEIHLCTLAVQMALYRLLVSFGVDADVTVGHSFGEYPALFAAGVLSARDTIFLVGTRAKLLVNLGASDGHAMLSVRASVGEMMSLTALHYPTLEIACINKPSQIVLAGPKQDIEAAAVHLKSQSITCGVLNLPFAYHSAQMDPILAELRDRLEGLHFQPPRVPVISSSLAEVVTDGETFDASYLCRQVRGRVNFAGGLDAYMATFGAEAADTVWLEIGTHPLCIGMILETLGDSVKTVPSLQKNVDAWTSLQTALASLHVMGYDIKWQRLHEDSEQDRRLLHLPAYAWEEKNFWISYKNDWLLHRNRSSVPPKVDRGPNTATVHTLTREETNGSLHTFVFESNLSRTDMYTLIKGHEVNGVYLCPASVFADIFVTVADFYKSRGLAPQNSSGVSLENFEIVHPITVPPTQPSQPQNLEIVATSDTARGEIDITLQSNWSPSKAEVKARARIRFGESGLWKGRWERTTYLIESRIQDLKLGLQQGHSQRLLQDLAYLSFSSLVVYSPMYYGMQEVIMNSQALEAVATVKLPDVSSAPRYQIYPPWVDSIIQVSGIVMNVNPKFNGLGASFICNGWKSLRLSDKVDYKKPYEVHVKMAPTDGRERVYVGNISLLASGQMVGQVKDVQFVRVPRAHLNALLSPSAPQSGVAAEQVQSRALPRNDVQQETVQTRSAEQVSPGTATTTQHDKTTADQVFEIIAEEVGMSVGDLAGDLDFESIGVDSLLCLTILARTKQSLMIELSQEAFIQYPNVRALRQYLAQTYDGGKQTLEVEEAASDVRVGEAGTLSDHGPSAAEVNQARESPYPNGLNGLKRQSSSGGSSETSSQNFPISNGTSPSTLSGVSTPTIVTLTNDTHHAGPVGSEAKINTDSTKHEKTNLSIVMQGNPTSSRTKLFLFPDGSGSPAVYGRLQKFPEDICVIALKSPHLGAGPDVEFSLESLVAQWVDEIRSYQPDGPYSLGGWSAGGYYSFEALQLLASAGEVVSNMVLIDSPPRNVYEPLSISTLDLLANKDREVGGDAQASLSARLSPKVLDHFACTIRAVERYWPRPVAGSKLLDGMRVTVIWASDGVPDGREQGAQEVERRGTIIDFLTEPQSHFDGPGGWERLFPTSSNIEVLRVPGNHFTLLDSENGRHISQALIRVLSQDEVWTVLQK